MGSPPSRRRGEGKLADPGHASRQRRQRQARQKHRVPSPTGPDASQDTPRRSGCPPPKAARAPRALRNTTRAGTGRRLRRRSFGPALPENIPREDGNEPSVGILLMGLPLAGEDEKEPAPHHHQRPPEHHRRPIRGRRGRTGCRGGGSCHGRECRAAAPESVRTFPRKF